MRSIDPLSITTAVVTLLLFAGQSGSRCHDFYRAYHDAVKIVDQIRQEICVEKEALTVLSKGFTKEKAHIFSDEIKAMICALMLKGGELYNRVLQLLEKYDGINVNLLRRIRWALKGTRKATELENDIARFNGTTSTVLGSV